uniref:Putative conserved plasma membrane protein n=1 Tax=Amblyomma aureolatum TaxID=187763 RepID=A0A1E1XI29_9ACAR
MPQHSKLYESLSTRESGVVTFTSRADAPPDAVLLSRSEAIKHQMNLYAHWKPKSDVWPITFGAAIAGIAASFGGFVLNAIFRKRFQLRHMGVLATTTPNIALPGIFAFLLSTKTLQDLAVMDSRCVICTQMEAMGWQFASGALYPCIMAPLACMNVAMRAFTYPILPVQTHYKEILHDILGVLQKHRVKVGGLAAFQCVLAFTLQHMQMRSILKVHEKLAER